jgi:preprotein translocase SecE subunit
LKIYKPNQAAMTRWLSALGVAMLLLSGAAWLWAQLDAKISPTVGAKLYIQVGIVLGLVAVLSFWFFTIFNKPTVVDFLIETEGEMKKVNWPPRSDTVKLTWIVIAGTFMMAAFLFVIDIVFAWLQQNFLMN